MRVKKFVGVLLLAFSFSASSLLADDDPYFDTNDYSAEELPSESKLQPFNLSSKVDVVSPSKIREGFYEGDEVTYRQASGTGSAVFYYCPAYTEGANVAVTYTSTYIKWDQNPWFDQDHFNMLTLSVGGFTQRACRWLWQTQVSINMDMDKWDLGHYANYDLLLWGRYTYCEHVGLHIGFLAQTGMRMDRVYPILGADWQMSPNWKLNLVFPVNVSIEYTLTDKWTLALAGRNFDFRTRASKNDSKNLVRYQNIGAEFVVRYGTSDISANIHAGSTLGGRLRMATANNHHAHTYKLSPVGYVGGEVNVKF
jgi:hypothetical protein